MTAQKEKESRKEAPIAFKAGDTSPQKERYPNTLTPEQRQRYEASGQYFRRIMQPMVDEIRRSEILTAVDFAVTINAR